MRDGGHGSLELIFRRQLAKLRVEERNLVVKTSFKPTACPHELSFPICKMQVVPVIVCIVYQRRRAGADPKERIGGAIYHPIKCTRFYTTK